VPSTDQRGKPRVGLPDIGSFESQGFTLTIGGGNNQSTLIGTPFANPLVVTATANNPVEPVAGGVVTFTGPTSGAGIVSSPLAAPITGNMASVTVMTNLIAGVGYPVQASVTGAMAMSFTLTNLPPTITLAPTTLPGGIKGAAYPTQVITAAGGIAPYTFTVTSSALPTGLTLNPMTGTLSGTPTVTGTFSSTVTATDRNGFPGSQQYTITITAAPLVSIAITCAGSATPSAKVGQSV